MAITTGVIGALAAVGGAGAAVYSATNAPKPNKPPPIPAPIKAPDTNALGAQQARQRAAALGRQSTIRTSPLGIVGNGAPAAGAGTSTSLGGGY